MAALEYDTESITDAVIARLAECQDPRFKQVMTSLMRPPARLRARRRPEGRRVVQGDRVPHRLRQGLRRKAAGVHPAVRHAGPVDAGGRARTRPRAAGPQGATPATEATVQGPFYWEGAPEMPLGSDIAEGVAGEPALYSGRVTDLEGQPLAGRAARRLVRRRRRRVRHADGGWRHARARPHPHRRAKAATGSGRSGPTYYPVPTTGRWATCCARWAGTPIVRATST